MSDHTTQTHSRHALIGVLCLLVPAHNQLIYIPHRREKVKGECVKRDLFFTSRRYRFHSYARRGEGRQRALFHVSRWHVVVLRRFAGQCGAATCCCVVFRRTSRVVQCDATPCCCVAFRRFTFPLSQCCVASGLKSHCSAACVILCPVTDISR